MQIEVLDSPLREKFQLQNQELTERYRHFSNTQTAIPRSDKNPARKNVPVL
jgi:hypothetical protein